MKKAANMRRALMLVSGLAIAGWSGPGVADHDVFEVTALQDKSVVAQQEPVGSAHPLARFQTWLREAISAEVLGAKPAGRSQHPQ